MLRRGARIDVDRANPARKQQARELGDLRVARQEMLPVPEQARGPHLPFHRAERGESRKRARDLTHRFDDGWMRRRIQAGQPERRSERPERAIHHSRIDCHAQRLMRAPFSSTVNTHVANREGSIAFQSSSLPELCGPAARMSASRTITELHGVARLPGSPGALGPATGPPAACPAARGRMQHDAATPP